MNLPKYLFVFVLAALVPVLSLPILNLKIDISRVLSEDFNFFYKDRDPNYRYLRVAHYLQEQNKYGNIIFGSSRTRVGFSEKTLGDRWYKMEYPGGELSDHLWVLEALLDKHVKLNEVILALDDHDFYNSDVNKKDYFLRPYPNSIPDWLEFYRFYLFRPYTNLEREVLLGERELIQSDRITQRPAAYRTPQKKELTANHKQVSFPALATRQIEDKSFENLNTFVDLCKKNGIKITVLITPRFFVTLYGRNLNHLLEINQRVAKITNFYDFRQAHPWSFDPGYWFETSHYTANYGDEVLKLVQGKPSQLISLAPDFDWYVTKDSVAAHNQRVVQEMLNKISLGKSIFPELKVHRSFMAAQRN